MRPIVFCQQREIYKVWTCKVPFSPEDPLDKKVVSFFFNQ
jgi:hypothetical protein